MCADDARRARPFDADRQRLFTVDEANALLPRIVPLLLELRADKTALDDAHAALSRLTPQMRANGHAATAVELESRIHALTREIAGKARRIGALGVEVKDLDHGLIDFPTRRGDRVVYLCWRLGEGPIAYWHEIDAGFAGRQPL